MTFALTTCSSFLLTRQHTTPISHDSTAHVSRRLPATKLPVNSYKCRPQVCVGCLWHLVCRSTVSRDLPSFRWHSSTQVTSLAVVTKPHLLCNLRQLSKPRSPPADVTTSKLCPSVRVDSTLKACPPFSTDVFIIEFRHTERKRCCNDHVL